MLIPLARLRPDSTPVRRTQYAEDDAALERSLVELGQLEPVLVVRLGDDFDEAPDYEVKEGNRRLAIAQKLGWLTLEASELARRRHLPRLDTAELLAQCQGPALREAATVAGVKFTTATAARRDLELKAESWRPAFADFGAPGPLPAGKNVA